jgi:hypothetical protein
VNASGREAPGHHPFLWYLAKLAATCALFTLKISIFAMQLRSPVGPKDLAKPVFRTWSM